MFAGLTFSVSETLDLEYTWTGTALLKSTLEKREKAVHAHVALPPVTVENGILQLHEYQAVADCMPTPQRLSKEVFYVESKLTRSWHKHF